MIFLNRFKIILSTLLYEFVISLPETFSIFRIKYFNKRGCNIHISVRIGPNVRISGKVVIDEGSSLAQNCTLSGSNEGIYIGKDVMVAPNVVIISFNHGFSNTEIPMSKQQNIEDSVIIEDNVWIAANCTIGKGLRIGKGSIIGANSFLNKNVPSYSLFGGVPAKFIKKIS
jgi:acetyltransferase-like isoleucine patch superfamily enzyme